MTAISSADSVVLAELAGAAERDMSLGPAVPPGWSVFETFPNQAMPFGKDNIYGQGFLASGGLPSDPSGRVTVIALAFPFPSVTALSSYNPISRPVGLNPLPSGVSPSPAQALSASVAAYTTMRNAIWEAYSKTPSRQIYVVGAHLGGAMAGMAAIDLRPGNTGPDGKTQGPDRPTICMMLSSPAPGDGSFANALTAHTGGTWSYRTTHLGTPIDTFPGAPVQGAVELPNQVSVPARIETASNLINDGDTWITRTAESYARALGGDPPSPGSAQAMLQPAHASIDVNMAASIADLLGLPYLLAERPGLRASAPLTPFVLGEHISDGAKIWGSTVMSPDMTCILIRGSVGWPEFQDLTCDYNLVQAPFSASEWNLAQIHSGAATLYAALQSSIKAAVQSAVTANPNTQLHFAGHGVGAGAAYLAAIDETIARQSTQTPRAWLFGAPQLSNFDFISPATNALPTSNVAFISRRADFLPQLPTAFTLNNSKLGEAVSLIGRTELSDPTAHGLSEYASLLSPRGLSACA